MSKKHVTLSNPTKSVIISNDAYYFAGKWQGLIYRIYAKDGIHWEDVTLQQVEEDAADMQQILETEEGYEYLFYILDYLCDYIFESDMPNIRWAKDLGTKRTELMQWTKANNEIVMEQMRVEHYEEMIKTEYDPEWTEELKEKIRKRDGYKCQNPYPEGHAGSLNIHHIDYDKSNSRKRNLITLCQKCHNKTNHNRYLWQEVYEKLMRDRFPKKANMIRNKNHG